MTSPVPQPPVPVCPELTLPEAEAAWVTESYNAARVILEYGSGGSTVLAGEMLGSTVFSVESDLAWAQNLQDWFDQNPPLAHVVLHPVNIGKTQSWGHPGGNDGFRRYHRYPITVWDRDDFQHPDLVLIDGRFRPACLITTMLRIERPVTVLFDDYVDRPEYHMVERYSKPVETRGRMARFELKPRAFPIEDMARIFEIFTRPR